MIEGTFEMVLRSSNVKNFRKNIFKVLYQRAFHSFVFLYSIDRIHISIIGSNFYNFTCQIFYRRPRDITCSLSILFKLDRQKIDTKKLCSGEREALVFWKEAIHGNSIRSGSFRSNPPCPWARWRWVPAVSTPAALSHLVGFARLPPRTRRKWPRRTRTRPRRCFSPPTCRNRGCDEFGVWNPCNASSCISCSPRRLTRWSWPAAIPGWSRYPVWKSATSSRYPRSWTWKNASDWSSPFLFKKRREGLFSHDESIWISHRY